MNRRAFLARSLRIPAAVAALPFVGGLATLAGASEPEAQGTISGLEVEAAQAEPVYNWWQVMMSGGRVTFHDISRPVIDERGAWHYIDGELGDGIALAQRNVLVRTMEGNLVRWGLDTGPEGWPVRP